MLFKYSKRLSLFNTSARMINYRMHTSSAKEIIDSYCDVETKVKELAYIIQESKYPIIFTGAGISTSLGIPDYRSAQNTVIKTGPGLWNRNHQQLHKQQQNSKAPIDRVVDLANPSLSHMFIATAIKKGIFKHLVSQNTDGLHMRSGIPIQKISELHGNRHLQHCLSCERKYFRDFRTLRRDGKVYKPGQKRDHNTGRNCENCGGELHDSIVYFGERLPKEQLANAYYHAHNADLCICVGSSLTVNPSSNVPLFTVKKQPRGKLCIINLQQTPLDEIATQKINYFCDEVFDLLSKEMKLQIQKPTIKHYLQLRMKMEGGSYSIHFEGKDHQMKNLSFMKQIKVISEGKVVGHQVLGHQSTINLSQQQMRDGILQIHHFRDKELFQVRFGELNLEQNSAVVLQYCKTEGKQWEIKQYARQ